MKISEIEFIGAKYHDTECGLYIDELPNGYYEKNGDVYLIKGDIERFDIVRLKD